MEETERDKIVKSCCFVQQLSLGVEMRGKSMKIGDVVTLELQKCEVSQ